MEKPGGMCVDCANKRTLEVRLGLDGEISGWTTYSIARIAKQ